MLQTACLMLNAGPWRGRHLTVGAEAAKGCREAGA